MIILQIDSLSGLKNNVGFWDNFVWPLAVAAVIGIFLLLKQFVFKPRPKKEIKPILKLSIDSDNNISLNSDNDILSKLTLIKQLIRQNNFDGYEIEIKATFKTNNFDQYQKKEFELKLKTKAADIKSKFEILLFRPFDVFIENSPDTLKIVIEKILERQPFIVSGRIKLDIYRTDAPKITFPVYLTKEDFETICKKEKKTVEEMKQILSIPTMCAMTIFPNEILLKEVIPALVNEIYRIRTNFNFDINTKGWDLIMGYEVGLG
jgi:hypothetical protein